jgi:hypothetical protein
MKVISFIDLTSYLLYKYIHLLGPCREEIPKISQQTSEFRREVVLDVSILWRCGRDRCQYRLDPFPSFRCEQSSTCTSQYHNGRPWWPRYSPARTGLTHTPSSSTRAIEVTIYTPTVPSRRPMDLERRL